MKVQLLDTSVTLVEGTTGESITDVIALLEQENKLLRARNERLEKEIEELHKLQKRRYFIWGYDKESND